VRASNNEFKDLFKFASASMSRNCPQPKVTFGHATFNSYKSIYIDDTLSVVAA